MQLIVEHININFEKGRLPFIQNIYLLKIFLIRIKIKCIFEYHSKENDINLEPTN